MALQIRGTSFNSSSANSGSAAITIPASTQPGDLLLQLIEVAAAALTQTLPGGWSPINSLTISNSSGSLRGAQRLAQIGDANTVTTFTLGTTTRWAAVMIAVYDDGGALPRIEQLTQAIANNTTSPITPAIDPINANDLLLAVMSGSGTVNGTQPIYTAGGSSTIQVQATSTSPTLRNASIAVASQTLANDNAVAAITHSVTQTIPPVVASILISNQNISPTANAGTDQIVSPGAVVTLNGSASSDMDGTIAGYEWVQLSGASVTLSDDSIAQPTFTAPASVDGATLVFGLTVTDNEGTIGAQDTVTVTVGATAYQHVWNGSTMEKQPVKHWVGGSWSG